MDGQGIESKYGTKFSLPVQAGSEAYLDCCTMDTGCVSRGSSGRGVAVTIHTTSAEFNKEMVELNLYLHPSLRGMLYGDNWIRYLGINKLTKTVCDATPPSAEVNKEMVELNLYLHPSLRGMLYGDNWIRYLGIKKLTKTVCNASLHGF